MAGRLQIRSRCDRTRKLRSNIGRLLHAYYSSLLDEPVPNELRSFVVQNLATEAGKSHSTARAIEVLQLAAAPIGRKSNRADRPS
jgi:hypothetical protein